MSIINLADVDLDVADRDQVLEAINHISASIITDTGIKKHNTGIYVQNIPTDPITGFSSIDYKKAEELGYFKLDILNLNVYKDIRNEEHLVKLVEAEPMWELLEHKEVVEKLYHIHNHFDIVSKMKPQSIDQLAMVLALIRPGKRHLLNKSWNEIEKEIWIKDDNDKYTFKKAHSYGYAHVIVMQMNLLLEEVGNV